MTEEFKEEVMLELDLRKLERFTQDPQKYQKDHKGIIAAVLH